MSDINEEQKRLYKRAKENDYKKYYLDLIEGLEELVKNVKEGKMIVENISCEPHLQPRYITDDLEETERKNKLEYCEYTITIRELK